MKKIMRILMLILIAGSTGCSWFEDNRVPKKLDVDFTSPEYKKTLLTFINGFYDSECFRMMVFNKALQEYVEFKTIESKISNKINAPVAGK